jgi:cytoskeletal protein RodZ
VSHSPSDRFDPCRAWLGIDRADLADPRRVLGIVPGETDPIVVLKAAETRLKALKGLAAGQHHAAREALILQVEQAREKVLSQIAAVGNGPAAAGARAGFAMPPPPRRPATPESDADGGATVLLEERGNSSSIEDATSAAPTLRIRPRRPVRRQGSAAIWVSILAMLASVAAGVGFIWWQARQQDLRQAARNQTARAASRDDDVAGGPRGDPGPRAKPLPEDAAISSSPPPPLRQQPGKKPGASLTSKSPATGSAAPEAMATSTPRTEAAMDEEPSTDEAAGPMASVADAPLETMAVDEAPADDTPTDVAASDDMAEASPAEASPLEDPLDATDAAGDEADAAISQALAAIRDGDFDTADALLASALEGGRSVPAKRRVSDWQTLAQYAREFAGFREKAIAEVRPGNEFDVNGKKVGIVEIDDKKFIYRFQGRNKTTPRNKIPAGIAMAIVTTWFDERPDNHLFLGAYHATKPEPDLAKAREHWERAEKGGINAEPLLRLLDDPALEAGAKASEPTDE